MNLVATGDIAHLAGVTVDAVAQWVRRGIFPQPIATTSAGKIWDRDEVLAWLRETGRLGSARKSAYDLVVTRHRGLLEFLREEGIIDDTVPVLESATIEDVRGKHVLGVLPLWLAAEAQTVTEAKLELTVEQRRRGDLPADETRAAFRGLVTYRVSKVAAPGR